MKKLNKIVISLIPIILILIITCGFFYTQDSSKIKTICKKLQLIDINIDHSQALDVIETAREKNIEIPDTIINFDTHSDLFVYQKINPKYGAQIYNWINELVIKNPEINTVYWVMPKAEAIDEIMQWNFMDQDVEGIRSCMEGNSKKPEEEVNPNVHKTPYVQYFWIDTQSGWMEEIATAKDEEKLKNPRYKKIKVITCTEETLPNFRNKKVFLSLDMDYISNSGYDTTGGWENNLNEKEIDKATSKMLSTIRKRNIRPEIISITLSPFYVPEDDEEQIKSFMEFFLNYSGKEDIIKEYSRQDGKPQVPKGGKKYKDV